MSYWIQKPKNFKLMNQKKKCASQYQKLRIYNNNKNMDSLHFVPNNILIWIFKKLVKYKNDYNSI